MKAKEEEDSSQEESPVEPSYKPTSFISIDVDSSYDILEEQCSISKAASTDDPERILKPRHRTDMSKSSGSLSQEQRKILDLVMEGTSVFFTGSAGTGKSYLLKAIIKQLRWARREVAVTASTGIAAIGIRGRTVHSWAGVGLGLEDAKTLGENMLHRDKNHRRALERWRSTDVLIIDEISMIDGRFFDKLEYVARFTRRNQEPFGGIQLVLVGDFFQLPPVPEDGLAVFAFNALTWDACVPKTIALKQVFRQKDDDQMRKGQLDKQARRILFSLKRKIDYEDGIYSELRYPTKDKVEAANDERLDDLPGSPHIFLAEDILGKDDNHRLVTPERCDRLLKDCRAIKKLTLKVGAVVMLIQNLTNGKLVNGSLGKVIDFQSIEKALGDNSIEVAKLEETEPEETTGESCNKRARLGQPKINALVQDSKMYNAFGVKQGKWDGQLSSFRDPANAPSSEDERLWPLVQIVNFLPSKVTVHPSVIEWDARHTVLSAASKPEGDGDGSNGGEEKDDKNVWKGTVVNLGGRPGEEVSSLFPRVTPVLRFDIRRTAGIGGPDSVQSRNEPLY
ncbi:dna repair and recombination protein pif1 [Phaffia rhodozyma]|uniref:ATP-dependent DNA helicase n=1 Tax=Phaffia rhodozyma TaxID=264483 RepID=A0A0F7SQZ5_PHARH|nr:dna repair and recombination protein pif1 [Phaffia rhodozyma]